MIGREHNREVVDKKKILEVQTGSKTITRKLDTKTDITFISKKRKKIEYSGASTAASP